MQKKCESEQPKTKLSFPLNQVTSCALSFISTPPLSLRFQILNEMLYHTIKDYLYIVIVFRMLLLISWTLLCLVFTFRSHIETDRIINIQVYVGLDRR